MEIMSAANAKVKTWAKYHQKKYRDQDGKFLVEGEHLIEEAIQANCLQVLLIRKGKENPFDFSNEVYEVSDEVLKKLSANVSSVDYIGVCKQYTKQEERKDKILILDDVQDPGNLGTMIRTAYSFGFSTMYLSSGCADVYNEKTIRSTQGALFHLCIRRGDIKEIITSLKKDGIFVAATSLHEAMPLSSCEKKEKIALVFGNEGQGVKEEVLVLCDQSVKIEMETFESLNVAVAAGICMYYFK